MMKKIYLILSTFICLSFTNDHKYYVALTDIEYNNEQESVQMIMNVFIDDIELALKNEFSIDAKISSKNEIEYLDTYFYKYLQKHFKTQVNNIRKDYKFIGKEYDGEIVFFYLEIEGITSVKTIEIHNTVLVKEYPNQQNLIKVKVNEKRKSLFLTKENDKGLLKF